jgi:hypothetical protein
MVSAVCYASRVTLQWRDMAVVAAIIKTMSLGPRSLQQTGRLVPRAFPPGRDTGMRRRSRCFRGGSDAMKKRASASGGCWKLHASVSTS